MKRTFVVMAALAFFNSLQAQNPSFDSTLEEVSITATRFPKKLSETGKLVTIISRQQLERAGGKDVAQLLNEQAGIVINGANTSLGKDKSVFIRGAANAYTAILVNGVPVNDPTGVGGAFDLRMIPVEAIERIEILKGAQSTLYGTDAVAGVINIITRKGTTQKAQLYGGLNYGRYKHFKGQAGLSGSLGSAAYNISFVHDETEGISEAKDTLGNQDFPRNGALRNAVSIDLNGAVTEAFHVKPFFRYAYLKTSFADDAFSGGQNPFNSRLLTAGTQAVYQWNKVSLTGLFSYDEVERHYPGGYVEDYGGSKKTAEVFSKIDWLNHFQTLAGLRYDNIRMKAPNPTTADTSVQMLSPFISLFLNNLSGFNLELGGRLNHHSRYGNNFTYSVNPSYLIGEKIKLFVNYGTAFRAPALSELYGAFGANPELKPETSATLEGGVQYGKTDQLLRIRASAFSRRTKQIIVYMGSSGGYQNFSKQEDHGFEIEPELRFNERLRLKLFYTYTDGTVTTSTASGSDTSYHNLFKRPKHILGADLGFQVSKDLYLSTHLQYNGKRTDLYFEPVPPYGQLVKPLDAYTLWDAYAEYLFFGGRLSTFLQLNNILDADYYEIYGYSVLGRRLTTGFRVRL
ncbi:TonB-dependent vitamin B12 receptor BtuB [Niabella terrae]